MKQRIYEQMQKECELYSIDGSYESESFARTLLGKPSQYTEQFRGRFLHIPGSNLIVGGELEDFGHSRIEKGFMDKKQMWFNRRYGPGCGVIKFSFERKGDIWVGKHMFNYKSLPLEAKTELLDKGPFDELNCKYGDIIKSFTLQLP